MKNKVVALFMLAAFIFTIMVVAVPQPVMAKKSAQQVYTTLESQQTRLANYLQKNYGKANMRTLISDFYAKESPLTAEDISQLDTVRIKPVEIKRVALNKNTDLVFLSNGCFAIEGVEKGTPLPLTTGTTKSDIIAYSNGEYTVWGQAYRDYYAWTGLWIFSVVVGGTFWYDYTSSGYYGNLLAWYKRGYVSAWRVEAWDKGTTSSYAYCQGNFYLGFSSYGVLTFQEYVIRHQVSCDKYGNIYRKYSMN